MEYCKEKQHYMDKYIYVLADMFCVLLFLHQQFFASTCFVCTLSRYFFICGFFLSQTYFITNVNKVQTTIILFLFKKHLSRDVSLESLILRWNSRETTLLPKSKWSLTAVVLIFFLVKDQTPECSPTQMFKLQHSSS